MAAREYENLDVVMSRGPTPGTYEARIMASPAGEAGPEAVVLTLSDDRMALLLMQMAPGVIVSRRVAAPDTAAAEELGSALFDAIFHGSLRDTLSESVARSPKGLRIRLRTSQAPELARMPWELMHDNGRMKFLALSERTPIVRYLDLAQPNAPLEITGPLHILAVISSPNGLPVLDVESEWAAIDAQLAPLRDAGLVQLDRLPAPTLSALRSWLRTHDVHVLHFVGHGAFDVAREDGVLYFADDAGNPRPVDPATLGPHLSDHDPLRLVVLNACQTGRSADDDPFGGMAQGLVERGVPAVVAMQFPITDTAAVAFAGDFYASIAAGQPVDQALSGSRRALMDSNGSEWATPVLFLRSDDGELFSVSPSVAAAIPPTLPAVSAVTRSAPSPEQSLEQSLEPAAHGRRRRPVLIAAVAVLLVGIVGAASWLGLSQAEDSGSPVASVAVAQAGTVMESSASASTGMSDGTVPLAFVPNVFGVDENSGLNELASAGFVNLTTETACSGLVGEGAIKEVWDAADQRVVNGATIDLGSPISPSTPLTVMIGNGEPCFSASIEPPVRLGTTVDLNGALDSPGLIGCPIQLFVSEDGDDLVYYALLLDPPVLVSRDGTFAYALNTSDTFRNAGTFDLLVEVPECGGVPGPLSTNLIVDVEPERTVGMVGTPTFCDPNAPKSPENSC